MHKFTRTAEKIKDADAILIGASNGLSITEGLHLFADNQALEELFGDFRRKYGLRSILQGMGARWPSEEEKWAFWSRLIHRYCGEYKESQVMKDLKAIVGDKDYLIEEIKKQLPTEEQIQQCIDLDTITIYRYNQ